MIGQTISHYRVTGKLGEGGMGAVYAAEDLQLQRPVALKFVSGEFAASADARKGVLHRDIKPGNIMLDLRGRVKVLDFGLAAVARTEKSAGETVENFITRTATVMSTGGTVPYMSPEQLQGQPVDARSDIFSFGVLLYECLAGRLPFPGETSIDILHAILRQLG